MSVALKRAYEPAAPADGTRILVDRLWPRGVTKTEARIDRWAKDLAPSTELRKWFGHEPPKFTEFKKRYVKELKDRTDELDRIRSLARKQRVRLLYGAKDETHNQAVVLREVLLAKS